MENDAPPADLAAATAATHEAIEAVFRIERARLIAGLCRMVRDVGLAEDLAQDAAIIPLAEWPKWDIPNNPGAWLMAVAKRRAIDTCRRGLAASPRSMTPWARSCPRRRSS